MTYRIKSLERIDQATLPKPMAAGWARWKAEVEFWDGPASGPALTDVFVMDRCTQVMAATGDDWSLESKEDSLIRQMTELIERHEPNYIAKIRGGMTGFIGDKFEHQHGQVKANDSIAYHPKVRASLGVAKGKDGKK